MERLTRIDGCGNADLECCFDCNSEICGADNENCGNCERVFSAEKKQTNFDRWKEQLTVEDFARLIKEHVSCYSCPARKSCNQIKHKCCEDILVIWANTEVSGDD
jgi:hypothetical protein